MMKRILGMSLAAAVVVGTFAGGASAQEKKKVLYLTKSSGFQHSVITRDAKDPMKPAHAEQILMDLGKQHGYEVTITKDADVFNDPATYKAYDVFAFYTTGDLTQGSDKKTRDGKLIHTEKPMSAEGKQMLLAAIKDGKGLIGFHCASDTFHSPNYMKGAGGSKFGRSEQVDVFIDCVGGEFCGHQDQAYATMRFVSPDFPGLKGFKDFTMFEEWYSLKNFSPDLHVILVQDTASTKNQKGERQSDYQRGDFPSTWARQYGKGRVYYTAMGHREDVWTNPIFQQVIMAGLDWAAGKTEMDVTPNIAKVTPDCEKPLAK